MMLLAAVALGRWAGIATFASPASAERCFDPAAEGPQGGGPPARAAASDKDLARVAELFARQDEALLERRTETVLDDFAKEFSSADFRCKSGEELLARWEKFLREHADSKLASTVLRAERTGDWIVADVRRLFTGACPETGEPIREESVETHVLRDAGGKLRIEAAYENESSKSGRIDRERRVYDARAQLCFQARLPEPFVPVPRRGPGAALDELLLLDPAEDATLGLMLFDPTVDEPLQDLLWRDCTGMEATFLLEPRRFERAPPGMTGAFEAEIDFGEKTGEGGVRRPPGRERAIYLSPDGRLVFALWLQAPREGFERMKPKVDELARSLRLSGVGAGRSFLAALLEKNARWRTLEKGVFRPPSAGVELAIPSGLTATPLLGDHIVRLRLGIVDDPKSSIIVRVFPGGEDKVPASKILEHTVQRMNAFACAEGEGGDSHRSDGTMDVLGRHGDWRGVEILCRDGSRRRYQIVAVDHDTCHVQVMVLPGSGNLEAQGRALKSVLDSLRVLGAEDDSVRGAEEPPPPRRK